MPFQRVRSDLKLTDEWQEKLERISRSRTEEARHVERAKMLLAYAQGKSISSIARELHTNRPKVERCVDKALQIGVEAALNDLPRQGKPPKILLDARAWVIALACRKPLELGYPHELWTARLLVKHIRSHCAEAGHPSLAQMGTGTLSRILGEHPLQPHRVRYYMDRRDPEFEPKMAQVLLVYNEVELLREKGADSGPMVAYLCYDEKPGIQALATTSADLPPQPGRHSGWSRDYEYVRHGTMSLMAGMDLLSGHIHAQMVDRHRSREFVQWLKSVDGYYPPGVVIRVILDNHSAHISKETRGYLATVPNRFEFVFTPKHGSWLNLAECLFAKMAKSLLRGMRVKSKDELKTRVLQHIDDLNEEPVVFKWTYQPESMLVT